MADPLSYGNPDRDVEQALLTLKKGSQLIKYSRKGKPKLCPFKLSNDETTLIWLSHKKERNLKLASVTRIVPGQRTAVFKRYPRPEKDYLSFSILYNNGARSLDLICKDQAEVEVWFTGLNILISAGPRRRAKYDGQSDGAPFSDDGDSIQSGRSFSGTLEISTSIARLSTKSFGYAREPSLTLPRSDVGSDHANMHLRSSNGDVSRLSISSAPSCSSQGSGPDDIESLGDVYVWGEVWNDGTSPDVCVKIDVLLPKPLESNVVLDVHQIACGYRHAALVTRQGEVFTWGEESGGWLGHGTDLDLSRPHLVESLALSNVDSVACGEYHTCAITTAGDLFTWGDGTHNTRLLGHGTDVSHWLPKRVTGPLEGLQVLYVACGTWHSALATANGKMYTFGDGTFGALGHGDRENVAYPREVGSLSGLRTIKVACGVWHTAAIVEVMGQSGTNVVSRKLFTWGDGDKNRLGHGDKEARLVPTCVPALIDYNFHQLACGHNITVALTTSGHVFTMGSSMNGQLGNPQSDGKVPCLVQDRLVGELVEEIACGSHHVVVLTSRSEVYTWGKGANGRLGHGDVDDRKTPALVEALKDRHVKSISCGSNFTACICIHKWVSGVDQSVCTGCRQPFGFTRKRHHCYNCGLVFCHSCSSKKVMKAALAPTPGKPHRVCDSCYSKLKAAEAGMSSTGNRKNVISRQSIDTRERFDREVRHSRLLLAPTKETVRYGKNDQTSNRISPVSSHSQLKEIAFPSSLSAIQTALRPIKETMPPTTPPLIAKSRYVSPSTWKSSSSLFESGDSSLVESLKKTNEHMDREILKLQGQVRSLKQKLEHQDVVTQKALKKAEQAGIEAAEESSALNAAVELIKTIDVQMKNMAEKFPSDLGEELKEFPSDIGDNLKAIITSSESFLEKNKTRVSNSSPYAAVTIENHRGDLEYSTESGDRVKSGVSYIRETADQQSIENGSRSPRVSSRTLNSHGEEMMEQFEPGVYVTVVLLRDGTKVFKRIKFSKRRFAEQQAEDWWRENQERVFRKYKNPNHNSSHTSSTAIPKAEAASSTDSA
ncbi:Ultraviolet-B receptor UVR8 [Apostasia shenzhenica]|uniref:Ultraviolet-B receptor UVR8 n=1 Tax=Apostasia shenzhenica TaxID=1088818 RepID=A0A2I0A984_9ASPA|nr:Ultraviolet-B receptor UVR8 [Apostasia shenzhenica]